MPIVPMLAVAFFHEKMDGIKAISMGGSRFDPHNCDREGAGTT
ncbi:hypothetical protein A2U01_0035429 [Trifolium medium]|uniref:Uncharacterized protein n=1 Tax=Trifolium medium TaxID=97028 RepID=A0A392PS27_9FABA|nr:hypothetical protein [Trifolium medium]